MVKVLKKYAWAGSKTFERPEASIALAQDLGLAGLHLVINDFVGHEAATDFKMRPIAQIIDLAERLAFAGLECHLMTWAMPHERFIAGMCHQLGVLLNADDPPPIAGLQFDCEGPWVNATGTFDYGRAGQRIREDLILPVKLHRSNRPIPPSPRIIERARALGLLTDGLKGSFRFGINFIGYTSTSKLDALASSCDYLCPQLYVPMAKIQADDIRRLCERARREIGESAMGLATDIPVMVGLAGSKPAAPHAQACIDAVRALPDWALAEIIYWNLHHLSQSKEMQAIVRAA